MAPRTTNIDFPDNPPMLDEAIFDDRTEIDLADTVVVANECSIIDKDNLFMLIIKYNNKKRETYTIITDNQTLNDSTGKYRRNTRSFTIVWND
jgi:hypothetical protein